MTLFIDISTFVGIGELSENKNFRSEEHLIEIDT